MSEVSETLRIMAANIDATRPECDYSLAHKRVDDSDIDALIRAADEIERLTAERDEADAEKATLKAERDEARREACSTWEAVMFRPATDIAADKGWDCFKEIPQ